MAGRDTSQGGCHQTLMRGSFVSASMSEAAGNWVTCPDCGNKFYAVNTDGDVECDECGTTV